MNQDWSTMNAQERTIYMLEYYSTKGDGRYAVLYKGRPLWFGNRLHFKTEGIARMMLNKYVGRNVPYSKGILDRLFDEGVIEIKQL